MNDTTDSYLQSAVASEFLALADLLDRLPDTEWDTPSLCTGWRVREVVAHMTGGAHAHFGFDLGGLSLRATDMDWTFGSGTPISGLAEDLALLVCGRQLPAGRIRGEILRQGTDS